MSKFKTIYESKKIAAQDRPSQGNYSGRLANICDRFEEIIRVDSPINKFSFTEITLIRECLGTEIIKPAALIPNLPVKIQESIEANRLDDKFEINKKVLLDKLNKLSRIQLTSLIEDTEKYWDSQGD